MKENHNCKLCSLHSVVNQKSICLKGRGSKDASLLIFLDAPTFVEDRRSKPFVSESSDYVDYLMKQMSIDREDYYLEYTIKCFAKASKEFGRKPQRQQIIQACTKYRLATLQFVKPKAVVLMGPTSCEAVMGSEKVGMFEGTSWTPKEPMLREFVEHVWITYNPAYGLQDIAESVGIYRVLFNAAIDAGLIPKYNDTIKKFDYGV